MKTLKDEQVTQLLQILQKKPAQRIVHFSDKRQMLSKHLAHFCQIHDNHYQLYCTESSHYEQSKQDYAHSPHVQVLHFKLQRPRYLIQAIEYDYLISTLDFTQNNKSEFLEKCYPIIRTGGNIILIVPRTGYTERDEWRAILEEMYYVSVNIIDDILDNYDVIVAKRLHGWGN